MGGVTEADVGFPTGHVNIFFITSYFTLQQVKVSIEIVFGSQLTVEEQTRKNSNFPVRGIFKNPREIIVNIFR